MTRLARAWRAWVALLDRREPADALALLRVLTGVGALHFVLSMVAAGVIELVYLDAAHGGYLAIDGSWWLVRLLGGPTPHTVWTLVVASLVGAAAVTIGLGGRLAPLLCAQALIGLKELNGQQGAYAAITANALWLLVLADSTATLSVDCRLRTGRWWSHKSVPAWPRYIAIAQLVLLYACTGMYKISTHWTPGGDMSALYYIMQQPTWQRVDMTWLAWVFPLTQIGTAFTWFFELSWFLVPAVLYLRHTSDRGGRIRRVVNRFDLRKLAIFCGVLLHTLIFIALEVGAFFFATLAFYPCLFTPHELRSAWSRTFRRTERSEQPLAVGVE